jgi:hypothetical protein
METIELTEANAVLRIEGSKLTRSITLKSLEVKAWPESGNLKLIVLDEKDMPIFKEELKSGVESSNGLLVIDKRFAFYDHLSVNIVPEKEDLSFSVILHFE